MKHNNRSPRKRFKLAGNTVEWPNTRKEELEIILNSITFVTRSAVMTLVGNKLISELGTHLGYASHHSQGAMMSQDKSISYGTCVLKGKHYCVVYTPLIQYIFKEL